MSLEHQDFEKLAEVSRSDLDKYEYLRITNTTPIDPPEPVITINGEIISTEGNITTISGESKSGKSAFTSICLAGAISTDGHVDGLDEVRVYPNESLKAVLHFDTEQARHKHQYNIRTINKRAGLIDTPEYFLSYNIRQLELKQYQEITSAICEAANEKFGGIHLMVIDGIADYITDVNDAEQANAIVKYFEELAIKFKTPIITIVHTNPGNDKERGHLGSQCQRKSESILIVKNDGDVSYIQPKFLRMAGKGDIAQIQFIYNKEKGYHVDHGIRVTDKAEKDVQRIENIKSICVKVFGGQMSYQYNDAIEAIMRESNRANSTAKGMFKDMKAHEMIVQGSDHNWRLNNSNNIENEE